MRPTQFIAHSATNVGAATKTNGQNGKKPNILFIMGDDIGMWNKRLSQ
jgi:hypothetical protein